MKTGMIRGLVAASMLVSTATLASAQTIELKGGSTLVRLDAGFAAVVGPITTTNMPGKFNNKGVRFPVTGGVVEVSTLRAEVPHTGGLEIACSPDTVRLLDYVIDTTALPGSSPVLTGIVVVGDQLLGRLPLFNLDVSSLVVNAEEERIRLSNIEVSLTDTAAGALNGVCGTSLEGAPAGDGSGGTVVGVATSTLRIDDRDEED